MDFRITRHSRSGAPDDAIDLLWQRLGPRREEASFTKANTEIRVSWGMDSPVAMERGEREAHGRLAILEILQELCEGAPELKLDWFAISARR